MTNYFKLFSLPESFPLEGAALEKAYFALQRQYHPDRFIGKSVEDRTHALQQSMLINEAYHTLKSPLKRAQYLLELQGIKVGGEHDTVKPSQKLLMENLEFREELAEAQDKEQLEKLAKQAELQYQEAIENIENSMAAKQWDIAAQYTLALGYIIKLKDEVMLKIKGIK